MSRLKQLVLMLSSDKDGEIVAAAHAIARHLQADGKDWYWLADLLDSKVTVEPFLWHDAVDRLLEKYPHHLSAWETSFLNSMRTWYGQPTPRQGDRLAELFVRFHMDVDW